MKLQLNYQVAYDFLINSCKLRGLNKKVLSFKTHKHHILPKCMGGLNIDDNYVLLTPKEHENAHHLLTLIYPDNNKLKFAYNLIKNDSPTLGFKHSPESLKLMSESAKKRVRQKFSRKSPTEETREKIRIANIGWKPTDEQKLKQIKNQTGLKRKSYSLEHRNKISLARTKCKIIIDGIISTVKEASERLNIPLSGLKTAVSQKKSKYKGYNFIEVNNG